SYPSLAYVERYRASFPDEVRGKQAFWTANAKLSDLSEPAVLAATIAQLEDQHVALIGPKAGKTETLGLLLRTATDGSAIVWRIFDVGVRDAGLKPGDRVVAIDGVAINEWLRRAAELTYGGNRRSRYAEAALELSMGTPLLHQLAHLGNKVTLRIEAEAH